jgi:hypothetical protein
MTASKNFSAPGSDRIPRRRAAGVGSGPDEVDDAGQVGRIAADQERGQDGGAPALELIGDLGPGADQRNVTAQSPYGSAAVRNGSAKHSVILTTPRADDLRSRMR